MRKPHGYAVISDPVTGIQEHDTLTCIHCGRVDMAKSNLTGKLEIMVFRADGTFYFKECGFCRSCFQEICPKCAGKPCNNRFRRYEEEEKVPRFTCD